VSSLKTTALICTQCGEPIRTRGLSQLARELAVLLPTGFQSTDANNQELRARIIGALCKSRDIGNNSHG
jgi:hypothetical protein